MTQSANRTGNTGFTQQSAQHLTHLQAVSTSKNPYEKFSIQFQLPSAMIWQIKFILSSVNSKKAVATAAAELSALSDQFGKDFDKYLLNELFEQIDLKDNAKAQKDKYESVKITLLMQELQRASQKPEFLTIFGGIIQNVYGPDTPQKAHEIIQEMTKRLKLNLQTQILVTLSLLESTSSQALQSDALKVLRQKIIDFHVNGKPEQLPEYAVHRILYLFDTSADFKNDPLLREPKQFIIDTNVNKFGQFIPLRPSLNQDISMVNSHFDLPSYNLLSFGGGLDDLEFANNFVQPWEIMNDLGPQCTTSFDFLSKILSEFKALSETQVALFLLQLAINDESKEDPISKIINNTFESNKDGAPDKMRKEPDDKKAFASWNVDNIAKVFKDIYSGLNWNVVFESFVRISRDELPPQFLDGGFEQKQFVILFQLISKLKTGNSNFSLSTLLEKPWTCPELQLIFIQAVVEVQANKKDFFKCLQLNKLQNKTGSIPELSNIETQMAKEEIEVWQSVDIVERLIILSDTPNLFMRIRRMFDAPINQLPEYLIISLSLAKPTCGNVLLDEILSIVMPIFLGNHNNSAIVLNKLFENNQALFIRSICELCKHDQKMMNLSRVLDITQEIKASLIKIVYSQDFTFAVNLGILAGKRDFLHYEVWIKSRIKDVGSPFINALIKYINENIIVPVSNFVVSNQQMAEKNPENFEAQKNAILERSHLSKEKLILTIDHLQNNQLRQNDKINRDTITQIQELVVQNQELFPQHYEPGQNSEEIEAAANEHFQRVFSADEKDVDQRIDELIQTMQNFKESQIVKEQEIYACMLHGLFDEYRFLHRYPPQYLTKIAKLFGAIIKNNLLDRVLQDIALKFVYEAFRRDNRRQKFGIIVIKSFFQMLPKFPKFLEDIYNIRQIIKNTEPLMMQEIEQLYHQMISKQEGANQDSAQSQEDDKKQEEQTSSSINIEAIEKIAAEEKKFAEDANAMASKAPSSQLGQDSKKEEQKKEKKNQVKANPKDQANYNQSNKQLVKNNKAQPQAQGNNTQHIRKETTPPLNSKEFIPTNRNQAQTTGQQNAASNQRTTPLSSQDQLKSKVFIPNKGQMQNQPFVEKDGAGGSIEPSSLVDHLNTGSISQHTQMFNFQQPANQTNKMQNMMTNQPGGSLNVRSAEFQRPLSNPSITPNMGQEVNQKQININSKEFMPNRQQETIQQKKQINQAQISQLLQMKQTIKDKIQEATNNTSKLRLDDLLEDSLIKIDDEYIEDQIRIICNNTGKSNFKQKIEDLKKYVIQKVQGQDSAVEVSVDKKPQGVPQSAHENLKWFIQYILTKRLGTQSQSLQGIYIEMIRELHHTNTALNKRQNVIKQTISQVCLIFKKCMLIDEQELEKVINAQQNVAMHLKSYVASLGSFVGNLTIAKNEPLRCSQLDLKQILVESSQVKNKKLAVVFVCRILKESSASRVFNLRNPWMITMMQILREVSNLQGILVKSQGCNEIQLEIESLFKSLNVQNMFDFKQHGIIESLNKPQNQLIAPIKKEIEYIYKKIKVILPSSFSRCTEEDLKMPDDSKQSCQTLFTSQNDQDLFRQQMNLIQKNVTVSNEVIVFFNQFKHFNERKLRKLVGQAVDNSIVEILPPVVDRSVTIALITTRELVLKDFAYDGDHNKVMQAADLIIQNLAGSLALVTCREPLRMSLNTNLRKLFEQYVKQELKIEIIQSTDQEMEQLRDDNEFSDRFKNLVPEKQDGQTGSLSQISEVKINDVSNVASRENLELGCMLIKQKVIEKAYKKVREDIQISQAIDTRQRLRELGIKQFRDETIMQQFLELPAQLQPNKNGLSAAQFQVYEDFAKLNKYSTDYDQNQLQINVFGDLMQDSQGQPGANTQNSNSSAQKNQVINLPSILKLIDQHGLNENNQSILHSKLQQMNSQQITDEEQEMLWTYTKRNFENACKNFDSRNQQPIQNQIEILSFIVKNYTIEDFSVKLLNKVFLLLDVRLFNDLELNILLMSKGIISISEWDRQIANYFNEEAAELPESELQFFANILEISIVERKILTKEQVPQLISVIKQMQNDRKIGKFCQYILNCLSVERVYNNFDHNLDKDFNSKIYRDLFLKWVVISYIDNKKEQEQHINTLFIELKEIGIESDPNILFNLSKVMIRISIERALWFENNEKRPIDRLDLRYIDSFVKLIVVLLTMLNFNKHEFMSKLFEFIVALVNEDHKKNQSGFNQRPYYRIIMNIMTAVNHQYCFNQKNQQLILDSLADMLFNLSPIKFPGFAFAWLELISHKQFMPHFLKVTQQPPQQQPQQPQPSPNQQSLFSNFPSLGQNQNNLIQSNEQIQKKYKIKELIMQLIAFLKQHMVEGQQMLPAFQAFYHATLRVFNVIMIDYPEFLSEFHFNFVNNLPEQCIQLKNLILYAHPKNIQQPDPFLKHLKIDKLIEIKQNPRILSNYENFLAFMNLKDDLENLKRNSRNVQLIQQICFKMEQAEVVVNGKRRINQNIISAVILFIAHQARQHDPSIEHRDTFKQMVYQLNDTTRYCFLNAIINELRFPNNHTFYFSCIILYIYSEATKETIQQQITTIFFERLQACGPYPWGLMISFRELIQNPKYKFLQKNFIREHPQAVSNLFKTRIRNFLEIVPHLINQIS